MSSSESQRPAEHNIRPVRPSAPHEPIHPQVSWAETDSEMKQANESLQSSRPLTWEQARKKLRRVLEDYMKSQHPVALGGSRTKVKGALATFFYWDLDLYLGALMASSALLILSTTSFSARKSGDMDTTLNVSSDLRLYTSQVIASVLMVVGTLISILLVRRRRYTCTRDADIAKRRTIDKFLSSIDQPEEQVDSPRGKTDDPDTPVTDEVLNREDTASVSGTGITDVYPVYRQTDALNATWTPVPTLLLVEGDFIALQVGDHAPARCRMMECDKKGNLLSSVVFDGGEKITVVSPGGVRRSFSSSLPSGRSTLKSGSRELLTLCDRMRIFRLEVTPLNRVLSIPEVTQRIPQIHRQISALRAVMFFFAVFVACVTFVVIFVRPGISSTDLSIVLPAPFLAALGALPVTTPACLFFLEVLGTARILVSVHPHADVQSDHGRLNFLLLRYACALISSRLSAHGIFGLLWAFYNGIMGFVGYKVEDPNDAVPRLVHVPPASAFLLEKLGVATAFAIVDDELACEPFSAPQQLMIPSGNGMKLLDICETFDIDSDDDDSGSEGVPAHLRGRSYGSSPRDSDTDSDDDFRGHGVAPQRRILKRRQKRRQRAESGKDDKSASDYTVSYEDFTEMEVQFEDPLWWQYLPSLKCIGLACLVADKNVEGPPSGTTVSLISHPSGVMGRVSPENLSQHLMQAERALVHHIGKERRRDQLRALGKCIGFSVGPNASGGSDDLSVFVECLRLHLFSTKMHSERLEMDAHALGLEESRSWGLLRPDCSSIIIQDQRSKAYQLLTVGAPRMVTRLCHEAWQGENSTIFPLNSSDRTSVLDTSTNWVLADLDVAAFSYSPVPHTLEPILNRHRSANASEVYLLDNAISSQSKDMMSDEWALVNDQIFLGVLGSSVIPRKDIDKLLDIFHDAGVRFVYFSPRNMRRTKELASQMGIDVAWNCAISLRALDEGQEDPHRMVSTYADWDVNAKLPHGIDNVRKHLEEVDNVPLLVSLFTDSTKETTDEMLRTFQDYSDTVLVMGLSHLARNFQIFAGADVSVGVDVLAKELQAEMDTVCHSQSGVLPHEISFVSAISAHPCAFSLRGATAPSKMPSIIASGRAALEAASAAGLFIIFGCVTFSLFVLFSMCAVSTTLPFVPTLGSVLYLQIVLPLIGIAMAASDADKESMKRVPPKNVQSVTFHRQDGKRLYQNMIVKGLLPSILPQILYLIAFGELIIKCDPEVLASECSMSPQDLENVDWTNVIRCSGLKSYTGDARTSGGVLLLSGMVLCVVVSSASFVHSTAPILEEPPWIRNRAWVWSCIASVGSVAIYLVAVLPRGSFSALPWYFFFLAILMPFLCLFGHEMIKRSECRNSRRAVKLRRLQFETKLGMWSPK